MMEGSMRTMSRSRYHTLSWSFMRIRGHVRSGGKRTGRAGNSGPQRPKALQVGFLARIFRSIFTNIRTGVVPRKTDI
jgi:hypothetical protein